MGSGLVFKHARFVSRNSNWENAEIQDLIPLPSLFLRVVFLTAGMVPLHISPPDATL
jgi:hypothetical protein